MLRRSGAALAIALLALIPLSVTAAATVASSTATSSLPTITALQSLIAQLEAEFAALVAAKGAGVGSASAPTHTHAAFTRLLSLGSTGADVSALQQILENAGFYTYPTITGYFGALTEEALAAYQTAHGLEAVGYTGPKTRALLNATTEGVGSGVTTGSGANSSASPTSSASTSPSLASLIPTGSSAGYGGGGGGGGGSGSSSPTLDTTPPSVSLSAPMASSTVSGTSVTLTATASDNVAIANVQFKVDGANVGSAVSSSPYTTTWSSKSVADGSHSITAVAEDTSGNYATSSIGVIVDNTPPVISAIASSSVASSTQTVTWTTNEPATSIVSYGLTTGYGTASSSAALVTSHSITLIGLTASTSYNFVVSSADGQDNTATSSNQAFTTAAYNYYVDSVNGSDANPGTSPSLAFQNITALPTIASGQSIGLADGSDWRQQLTVSGSNVTIAAYGVGARPILDASSIISNASFTKTAGYTNVYNTATTTFACLATYGAGCAASWINVWETGAAGDNANGQTLVYETSIASVDSTACSYYLYGGQTTGSGAPTSATIYIHSCDGSSPIANGYTYEYANRRAAIYSNGNSNVVIAGIEGRKAVANTGPFDFENDDGGSITLNNVLARDCNDHCSVLPGGSTVENSTFLDGYWGGTNSTLVVFYESVASGKPFTLSSNIFQSDEANLGINAGMIAHSGNLANLGTVTSSNNWFISKNGAGLIGYQLQYVPQLTISGDHASQLYQYLTTLASTSVSNTQYVSAVSLNTEMQIEANGASLTLSDNSTCTENDAHIVSVGNSYTGTSITDSGSTYFKGSPNASAIDVFNGSSTALAINNDTFDGAINPTFPYNFSGSGSTFTGGTTAGTANSYNAADHVTRFIWNGATYTSLSQWLAAIGPQDSSATTTRSGASACTLPTIPTVS